MNFDFSDDLKQLRDQARRFLSEQCTPAVVRRSLDGFRGAITQVPPAASAVHIDGERAYKRFRRGEEVVG